MEKKEENFLMLLALLQAGLKEVSARILVTCPEQGPACRDLAAEVAKLIASASIGVATVTLLLMSTSLLNHLEEYFEQEQTGEAKEVIN